MRHTPNKAPLQRQELATELSDALGHPPALSQGALKPRAPLSHKLVPPERLNQRLAACARLHELHLHELLELRLLASHAMCERLGVRECRPLSLGLAQLERLCSALVQSQSAQR
eukprot:2913234-Prymnesium_polylepis.1